MKYILALLLLASAAFADIHRSFNVNLNKNARMIRVTTTTGTWASARDNANATTATQTSVDTLTVSTAWVDAATDTFKIIRSMILTDTLNSITSSVVSQYLDSIRVTTGNECRLDSFVLYGLAKNGRNAGGCTGQIYALVSDTCATIGIWTPTFNITIAQYNDYLVPATFATFFKFDSVAVNTSILGMGDTMTVSFAITDRTILDEIECIINSTTATATALRFDFVTCYDYDNVAPVSSMDYDLKLSFNDVANGTKPFHGVMYWTEVEPVTASGDGSWQGSWRNAVNTGWRNLWR